MILLPDVADDAARFARSIVQSSARLSPVWPEFWAENQGFIVYSPDGALLLSSGAAPAKFRWAGMIGHLHAYWHDGEHPQLIDPFVLDFQTPGGAVAGINLREAHKLGLESFEEAAFLFHEAFHAHQQRAFVATHKGGWVATEEPLMEAEFVTDASFLALLDVERAILADALLEQSTEGVERLLREYAAVRRMRMLQLPAVQQQTEAHVERKEASAQWVGYAAALLATEGSQHRLPLLLHADLTRSSGPVQPIAALDRHRSGLYASGASLGYLLERVGMLDWKDRVQSGATFSDLLFGTVPTDPAPAESPAPAALLRYGYEQRRAQRSAELAAGEAAPSEASFHAGDRPRIVIQGLRPTRVASVGPGSARLASGAEVYTAPSSVRITSGAGVVEAEGSPVLFDPRSAVIVLVSEIPRVDGLKADKVQERPDLLLPFTGGSIRLHAPVRVWKAGNTLFIEVLP